MKGNPLVAPGHNPKETPEMFVEKVLRNQKRIENTIKLWEENKAKEMSIAESVNVDRLSESEAVA